LHGWKRDYPPDVFGSLWDNVVDLAKNKRLIAPYEVLLELQRGGDEIYKWAKSLDFMFLEPNDEVQQIVSEIVNKYPSFVPEESKDGIWADPYVIALAKAFNAVVVTGEKMVGPGAKTPKIPNICRDLQIQCIDFLELIRRESWRF
jgi:tRNA splicing ligase